MSFLKDYIYPRIGPLTQDESALLDQVSAWADSAVVAVKDASRVVDEFIITKKIDPTMVRGLPAPNAHTLQFWGHQVAADTSEVPARVGDEVWVNALMPSAHLFKTRYQTLRSQGIQSQKDITLALDYLHDLDSTRFGSIVDVIRKRLSSRDLSIVVAGDDNQNYSYARVDFTRRIDRTTPVFGKIISLHQGATPDVLLHEIVHTLPVEFLGDLFHGIEFPLFPSINPDDDYGTLRQNILAHMRLDEVLSFASECIVFDSEKKSGFTHVFNENMMSNIYGSWVRVGIEGLRSLFTRHLPHYAFNEQRLATMLAIAVKTEGTKDLTWKQIEDLAMTSSRDSNTFFALMQNYINRYVEKNNLNIPPDFYNLQHVLRRTERLPAVQESIAVQDSHLIENVFLSLESLKNGVDLGLATVRLETSLGQDHPDEIVRPDYEKVFVAYAQVIDRVLVNPPASFSREELAALVSFVRLTPPQATKNLAEQMMVYLGNSFNDLRVTLGLILYEKGFVDAGTKMVFEVMDLDLLLQTYPMVYQVMGSNKLGELLLRETDQLFKKLSEWSVAFQDEVANDLIMDDDQDPVIKTFKNLIQYPPVLTHAGWHALGVWLATEVSSFDTSLDDEKILQKIWGDQHRAFFDLLRSMNRNPDLVKALNPVWDGITKQTQDYQSKALKALECFLLILDAEERPPWEMIDLADLGMTSPDPKVFKKYPKPYQKNLVLLSEASFDAPWSDGGYYLKLVQEEFDQVISLSVFSASEEEETRFFHHKKIFETLFHAGLLKAKYYGPQYAAILAPMAKTMAERLFIFEIQDHNNDTSLPTPPPEVIPEDATGEVILPPDFVERTKPFLLRQNPLHNEKRLYDDVPGLTDDEEILTLNFKLSWLEKAAFLAKDKKEYFDWAYQFLEALIKNEMSDFSDKMVNRYVNSLCRHVFYWFDLACGAGDREGAQKFYQLISVTFKKEHPPKNDFVCERESKQYLPLSKFLDYYQQEGEVDWHIRFYLDLIEIKDDDQKNNFLNRIRQEIDRGGSNLSAKALDHFGAYFLSQGDERSGLEIYRLMVRHSLYRLDPIGLKETLQALQSSNLPEGQKDELLHSLIARLFDLMDQFRGINLNLIEQVKGLFPWRTPFMKAHDLPHYPLTEALLIRRLAAVPEFVDDTDAKNDLVRLSAFSAAGLPLQRYAGWMEHAFDRDLTRTPLAKLDFTQSVGTIYERLELPHPRQIPVNLSEGKVRKFLDHSAPKMKTILLEGDDESAQAVLRVIARTLGSELREKNSQSVSLNTSYMARFVQSILAGHYQGSEPFNPQRVLMLADIFFTAGPHQINRLEMADQVLAEIKDPEQVRTFFAKATQNMSFSSYVQNRIKTLKAGGDFEVERGFYHLLLSIRYTAHPGGMISDFLLRRLETDPPLRKKYQNIGSHDPYIMSEFLLTYSTRTTKAFDTLKGTNPLRLQFLEDSIQFLKLYLPVAFKENYTDFATEDYLDFNYNFVLNHDAIFGPLLKEMKSRYKPTSLILFDEQWDETLLDDMGEALSEAGITRQVTSYLDENFDRSHKKQKKEMKFFCGVLTGKHQEIEKVRTQILREEFDYLLNTATLPDFITQREGLEKNLLIATYLAMDPSQRRLLDDQLKQTTTDEERILALGQTAHLEKLLQLASVHPLVPLTYRKLFEVFQEHVPSRDFSDVARTVDDLFSDLAKKGDFTIDLKHPVNEGTMGGVYRATILGRDVLIKVMPAGKRKAIDDSLKLVSDVLNYLDLFEEKNEHTQAVGDFLKFYLRIMNEEMNFNHEIKNREDLSLVLPSDVLLPHFYETGSFENLLVMEPLYSRRLDKLSDQEREYVFKRFDDDIIPSMIQNGVFHFDLHPGNVGVTNSGQIVLYDLGRVGRLSLQQRVHLFNFYNTIKNKGDVETLKTILLSMGEVKDKVRFEKIDELLNPLIENADPLKGLEDAYPKLAQYGFTLYDDFVKLILMYVTWNGTKNNFLSKTVHTSNGETLKLDAVSYGPPLPMRQAREMLLTGGSNLVTVVNSSFDAVKKAADSIHKGLMATHWLSQDEMAPIESDETEFIDSAIEADQLSEPASNENTQVAIPLSDINPFIVVTAPVWGLQPQMGFVH